MSWFKELLTQCPHHSLERYNLCQIAYEGLNVSIRTMVESMCEGGFLCKNTNEAWDFLEDLNDKTYEWGTIREPPSITSKIFIDNKGKLPNDFIALEDTTLHCEHQLEVPLFQPPQPHDYIPPFYSYDFLLDYGASYYAHPFNQTSFEGVSDPLLYPLLINTCLKTRDTFGGDMVFDNAPFLLASLRENDESEKLVAKASYEFEYDKIVVSKDILVKEEYSLEETIWRSPVLRSCLMIWNVLFQSLLSVLLSPFPLLSFYPSHHYFTFLWILQCPPP